LSDVVFAALRRRPGPVAAGPITATPASGDDDRQLTLFVLQQLSFRSFAGVDPAWEDHPSATALRHDLESRFEHEVRSAVRVPSLRRADELPDALVDLLVAAEGPSLSGWMEEHGTIDHLREFAVHRSAYQLQEADAHTFAIPRLAPGPAKTAMLELQIDEYGGHVPEEAHAVLFADTMRALDLEPVADLDRLPAATLRTNTFLNLLGRSRRLAPACVGHLAVFEMTSVDPMARYAAVVRRVLPSDVANRAARFYDVHVAADGYHGRLALDGMVADFAAQHPDAVEEVLFGAAGLIHVEQQLTEHLLTAWERGTTSLRTPLDGSELRTRRAHLHLAS
jgi:hypothetical protein